MIIPDVNVLLYAEIAVFAQHVRARSWWEETLNGDDRLGMTPVSLFGFLRIATNRRVFTTPLAVEDAVGRASAWLERPNTTFLLPGARHLEIAFGLLKELGTAANLTTDVQLAAHAIENQSELHSHDSGFARFAGLRWVDPLR